MQGVWKFKATSSTMRFLVDYQDKFISLNTILTSARFSQKKNVILENIAFNFNCILCKNYVCINQNFIKGHFQLIVHGVIVWWDEFRNILFMTAI